MVVDGHIDPSRTDSFHLPKQRTLIPAQSVRTGCLFSNRPFTYNHVCNIILKSN
ncbi:predicted protein [Neisseria gonorrhoeae SK-92-679]|nr:predicted protein [Neisseria gonorrhoeae SK-92-679]